MRAQAAVEYMMLIGAALIIIISISYYATHESTRSIQNNQINDAVNTIAKAANSVYALGPGSQQYIEIIFPGGIQEIQIQNSEILFKIIIFGGISDVFAETKPEVTGSLSITKGTHHILIKALDSGIVEITE